MQARKKAADPAFASTLRGVSSPRRPCWRMRDPRLAEQVIPVREHLLQLQRTAGNKAVAFLVGPRFTETTVVQRQPQGTQDSTSALATPVSPEEMFRRVVEYQRAIKAMPKGAPPATSKIDPKGVGRPSGHGTWTGAAIQVLDASGKRVDIGYGMYAGGDDGEIPGLRQSAVMAGAGGLTG